MFPGTHYVIRLSTASDQPALRRIAELDSQRPLSGPVLVGEIDGEPAAALALDGGRFIADPFQRTNMLRQAMRLRASALEAHSRTPSVEERIRSALAPFRARARTAREAR